MKLLRIRFLPLFVAIVSCAAPASHDGGIDAVVTRDVVLPSDGPPCVTDRDCDDQIFCDGVERCMPGAPTANRRGCLPASPATPCLSGQTCNESTARCTSDCGASADADHDGHRAIECGGDDCDDSDPQRFPGNAEFCFFSPDPANHRPGGDHDEDCDPTTLANPVTHDGDHDGDGYIDRNCLNLDRNGMAIRGTDCDDADVQSVMLGATTITVQPGDVHPTQAEVCNGVDDNCDGHVDEGLPLATYFPDCDGDGFGAASSAPSMLCATPSAIPTGCSNPATAHWVSMGGDCDDARASVHPGATELCDGSDDDCDGAIEPDADHDGHFATGSCTSGAGSTGAPDDCRDDVADVHGGQTMYFARPACAPGMVYCETTIDSTHGPVGTTRLCLPAGSTCVTSCGPPGAPPCPTGMDATWDYDCNGTADPEHATVAACQATGSCAGGCHPSTGMGVVAGMLIIGGLSYTGMPACGSAVPQWACPMDILSGSHCTCAAPVTAPATTPLPCR